MSLTSVCVLFVISKLLGKKQIAQLEFIDYAIGISIGSIAAEMATDIGDKPIQYYIFSMAIFFIFDIFVSYIGRKSPALKHFFKGRPITVIYEGNPDYKALKKSKLDVNDVIELCREQGYFDLSDIAFAVFENSGKLSIMPVATKAPVQLENLALISDCKITTDSTSQNPTNKTDIAPENTIIVKKASLPFYMIVDGKISYSSLTKLNKNVDWLLSELNVTSDKELKNILLSVYDDQSCTLKTTLKQ